jgi:DNA-binding NtrC family response regulator
MNPAQCARFSVLEEVSTLLNRLLAMLDYDIPAAVRACVRVLITAEDADQRSLCAGLIHVTGISGNGPLIMFPSYGDGRWDPSGHSHTTGDGGTLRRQFDLARGGTLYLHDIAALSGGEQRQLLTRLEEEARCSAGARPGVRVIAGASHHLDAERATGAFGESLFYRLNLIHVDLTQSRLMVHSRARLAASGEHGGRQRLSNRST